MGQKLHSTESALSRRVSQIRVSNGIDIGVKWCCFSRNHAIYVPITVAMLLRCHFILTCYQSDNKLWHLIRTSLGVSVTLACLIITVWLSPKLESNIARSTMKWCASSAMTMPAYCHCSFSSNQLRVLHTNPTPFSFLKRFKKNTPPLRKSFLSKDQRSLRPLWIIVGKMYYVDKCRMITIMRIVVENTIPVLILNA